MREGNAGQSKRALNRVMLSARLGTQASQYVRGGQSTPIEKGRQWPWLGQEQLSGNEKG